MAEVVDVKGLRELQAALKRVSDASTDRKFLNSALLGGATLIVNEAKARVPVDTGELRRNIRARSVKPTRHTATVQVGVRKLLKKQLRKLRQKRPDASDPFYWRFVEFGTSRVRARPFLRPAFERKKLDAIEAFKARLADRIAKAAK